MPTYEYRFEDTGEITEVQQSIHADALTAIDGRAVTRMFGLGTGLCTTKAKNDSKYPYASSRLPRNMPGCRSDALGKPIIESKRHERELAARYGLARE